MMTSQFILLLCFWIAWGTMSEISDLGTYGSKRIGSFFVQMQRSFVYCLLESGLPANTWGRDRQPPIEHHDKIHYTRVPFIVKNSQHRVILGATTFNQPGNYNTGADNYMRNH